LRIRQSVFRIGVKVSSDRAQRADKRYHTGAVSSLRRQKITCAIVSPQMNLSLEIPMHGLFAIHESRYLRQARFRNRDCWLVTRISPRANYSLMEWV
jgi:hypothetical protein